MKVSVNRCFLMLTYAPLTTLFMLIVFFVTLAMKADLGVNFTLPKLSYFLIVRALVTMSKMPS